MTGQNHDYDQADAHARAALHHLEALAVPPTPANFELWYAYAAAEDAQLVQVMNVLYSNGDSFSSTRLAELHHLYFGSADEEAERLTEISTRMEKTLATAIEQIQSASDDAQAFSGRVESLAMGDNTAHTDPTDIIRRMFREAQEMAQRSRNVNVNLVQSRRTVETLRNNLAEMREAAETDALTGLPNRRIHQQALDSAAAAALETGKPLSVAMLDIDHFKQFNDTHGHLMGDQVLRIVADILREKTRESDVVARYGGEEFSIVFPNTDVHQASAICQRIRYDLGSLRLKHRDTNEYLGRITLSCGIGQYISGESLNTFIRRADYFLYAAKRRGRDRVLTETASTSIDFD